MAIREYCCDYCGHIYDEIVYSTDPDEYQTSKCRCGSWATVLPGKPAPSRGNFGTVRRNTAKEKPQKFNFVDEPDSQLEFDLGEKK